MLVTGKVIDKATKEPLPNANVYFKPATPTAPATIGTTTDINGNYFINGTGTLYASYTGYKEETKTPATSNGVANIDNVNFELISDNWLPEINIIAVKENPIKTILIALAALVVVYYLLKSK